MYTFTENYRIHLTPISSLHIGCEEAWTPANSFLSEDNQFLIGYNSMCLRMPEQDKKDLQDKLNNALSQDALRVQWNKFLDNHKDIFLAGAECALANCKGFRSATNFPVLRHIYRRTQTGIQPYIPGSSLKGSVRTAQDNSESQTNNQTHSKFHPTPIAFSDLLSLPETRTAVSSFVRREIETGEPDNSKNRLITTNEETICPAQYRAFHGELRVQAERGYLSVPDFAYPIVKKLLKNLNAFYLPLFKKNIERLRIPGNEAAEQWWAWMSRLIALIEADAKNDVPSAAIIRLGKNSGKESFMSTSNYGATKHEKTYFSENTYFAGVPIYLTSGWALLEIEKNPSEHYLNCFETEPTKSSVSSNNLKFKEYFSNLQLKYSWAEKDFSEITDKIEKARENLRQKFKAEEQELKRKADSDREIAEKEAKEEAEKKNLNPQQNKVHSVLKSIFETDRKVKTNIRNINPGDANGQQLLALLRTAASEWDKADRDFFIQKLDERKQQIGAANFKNAMSNKTLKEAYKKLKEKND